MAPDLDDETLEFAHRMFDLARYGGAAELATHIDAGLPVNLTNSQGDTLLILGAYHKQTDVVRALLPRGADLDRVNDRGQTALAAAVFRQDAEIVRMLLDAGGTGRRAGSRRSSRRSSSICGRCSRFWRGDVIRLRVAQPMSVRTPARRLAACSARSSVAIGRASRSARAR